MKFRNTAGFLACLESETFSLLEVFHAHVKMLVKKWEKHGSKNVAEEA